MVDVEKRGDTMKHIHFVAGFSVRLNLTQPEQVVFEIGVVDLVPVDLPAHIFTTFEVQCYFPDINKQINENDRNYLL